MSRCFLKTIHANSNVLSESQYDVRQLLAAVVKIQTRCAQNQDQVEEAFLATAISRRALYLRAT